MAALDEIREIIEAEGIGDVTFRDYVEEFLLQEGQVQQFLAFLRSKQQDDSPREPKRRHARPASTH